MNPGATDTPQENPGLAPLNVIRVETALSRYPVHRLAKQGTINIEIREQNQHGEVLVRWEVDSSRKYGQPGPLAYKLDTLIVNRRIEEASRPIPEIIRLGSLHDICHELGITEGRNRDKIKTALLQNAFAGIEAKLSYKVNGKSERTLEAGFNRYGVVFTGEDLPDGRKADGVYLVLNVFFLQVLNGAQTRPLDYDYLRDLPPAAQRLYEILSYQIYAALKNGRPRAKLSYGEFCTHAPLTRHVEWLRVRTQMNKLHAPHKESGYIQKVEFEQTTDRHGKPDWWMFYTPGPKAKAEFLAFDKKGGPKTLVIEDSPPAIDLFPEQAQVSPLEQQLIERGVRADIALKLVTSFPELQISRQIEHFDWLKKHHPQSITKSDGGFLKDAIGKDYPTPPGFETKAQKESREKAKRDGERRATIVATEQRRISALHRKQQARVVAYLAGLDAVGLEELTRKALEHARPEERTAYEKMPHESLKSAHLRVIRESYARKVLGLPEIAHD